VRERLRRLAAGAGLLLGAVPALGARPELSEADVFGLMPDLISVGAARHPQPVRDSPSAVTVITAEEIRASGAWTLPELLRSVPGLHVVRASASEWSVVAHERSNFPGEGVLTLIDGRAVYLDFFSVVLWEALPVSLEEVERIEVVTSPGSALWGANAMNGIINIVTKDPAHTAGTRFTAGGGDFRRGAASVVHGGAAAGWGYRVSGGYDAQSHFTNPLTGRRRDDLEDRSARGNAMVTRGSDGGRTTLRAGVDDSLGETLTSLGIFERDGTTSYGQVGQEWGPWKLQAYYNGLDARVRSAGVAEAPVRTHTVDAELQHSLALPLDQLITWGGGGRFNTAHAPMLIGESEEDSRWSLFVQDELPVGRALKLTLGGRFDAFSVTKDFVSGRFGAVWSPLPAHVWRASAGRSFNKPDTVDLFADVASVRRLSELNPALPAVPYTVTLRGNPDLAPERVDAVELGYQNTSFRRWVLGTSAFVKHQRDDVAPAVADYYPANALYPGSPAGAFPRTLREVNLGDGRAWGGDLSATWRLRPEVSVFANYSVQRESGLLLGQSGAENKANAGVRWSPGGWTLSGAGHYVDVRRFEPLSQPSAPKGSLRLPPYVTADAHVGWRPVPSVELGVSGVNLLNDKHREFVDTDLLERLVMATVTVDF
jgi:iron complex outermembrane receptor protein